MAQDDIQPTSMAALRERIGREWDALQTLIQRLSEAELTRPGPDGGWSIKDHVAHLTGWEDYLLRVLNHEPAHAAFGVDAATFETLDTDGVNARLYERSRHDSLAKVLDASKATHQRVLTALEALRDEDLSTTMAEFGDDPGDERTVLEKIAVNTYEHDAEHRAWMLEQVDAWALRRASESRPARTWSPDG
jgi:hypothetical protein